MTRLIGYGFGNPRSHFKYYHHVGGVGMNEDCNQGHRSREEHEQWAKTDHVRSMRTNPQRWFSESEIVALERAINSHISESIRKAVNFPFTG
jgi:TPP-dependent pyruvate/acetoin dehydrogenase alpha subunit